MLGNYSRFVSMRCLIGAGVLAIMGCSAHAQDANHFVLHLTNDGDDMYVTLLDQNAGSATILQNARVNHQERKDVLVTKDGNGRASVSWTTKTAGSDKQKCGSGSKSGFSVGTEITVSADRSC